MSKRLYTVCSGVVLWISLAEFLKRSFEDSFIVIVRVRRIVFWVSGFRA